MIRDNQLQEEQDEGVSNRAEEEPELRLYQIHVLKPLDERALFDQLGDLFTHLWKDGFLGHVEDPRLRGEDAGKEEWKPVFPESELSASPMPGDPMAGLFSIISKIVSSMSRTGEQTLLIYRESSHVDPVFRDCYYSGYARQHFDSRRFSARLSFFSHEAPNQNLFSSLTMTEESRRALQRAFIGCVVLNPTASGAIGRVLIDPRYLLPEPDGRQLLSECAVRLSRYKVTVRGMPLTVSAFPYRTQDGFMLRCVEVTLVNLIEYYSNEYGEYSMVLPSKIHMAEEEYLNERTVPAKGITYLTAAKLLSSFGFQARLHSIKHSVDERERFRRVFQHYLESGIPVAMNPADGGGETGHSLLCVGIASALRNERRLPEAAYQFGDTSSGSVYAEVASRRGEERATDEEILDSWTKTPKCNVMMSADFPWSYVVIDDNQPPYQVRDFDHLSLYSKLSNSVMLVALHKGIMLDARDAEDTVLHILSDGKNGLFNWAKEFLERKRRQGVIGHNVDIVLRLLLVSSRRYKKVRIQQYNEDGEAGALLRAEMVAEAAMPHFLWISEVYLVEKPEGPDSSPVISDRAFAELAIDATHGRNRDIDGAIVLWNYPDRIAVRNPDNRPKVFDRYDADSKSPDANERYFTTYQGVRPFNENLNYMRFSAKAGGKWNVESQSWFSNGGD